MKVHVVSPSPVWKHEFEAEAARITAALGDLPAVVHHIGSTAIPGIYAKPILDILLEVENVTRLDAHAPHLADLGYEAKGEFGIPGRRYFRKDTVDGVRTHQIHAFDRDSADIVRHLAFRDFMIAHPAIAQSYSDLKRKLADSHPEDMEAYMDGKDAFIKEHEMKAQSWKKMRIQAI